MNSIVSQMSDTLETCAFKGHFPVAEVLSVPLHLEKERTWLFTGLSFLCSRCGKGIQSLCLCACLYCQVVLWSASSQGHDRAHFSFEEKHFWPAHRSSKACVEVYCLLMEMACSQQHSLLTVHNVVPQAVMMMSIKE